MPRSTLQLTGSVPAGNGLLATCYVLPESTGLFVPGLGEPGLGEEGTIPAGLQLLGDVNVDMEAQAKPSAGVTQRPGLIIEVDGVAISLDDVQGQWTVDRTIDRPSQTFQFTTPVVDGISALGDPFTKRAPSAGLSTIDVYGAYRTPAGETVRTILITDGIVDRAPRSGNPKNGYSEEVSGTDSVGRIMTSVTRIFPVGNGLDASDVVEELLRQAGETMFRFEPCNSPVLKEIQAVDADPLQLGQEIFDARGRRMLKDTEGYWINPRLGPPTKDSTWTFREEDILATAEVSVDFPGDPVTDVTMTGTEQIARDDEGDTPCGISSPTKRIEVSAPYAPVVADYQQTDGSIDANSQDTARTMVTALVITTREMDCGILKRQKQEVYGWYNPQMARYKWNGASPPVREYLGPNKNVAPGAQTDDTAPAFAYHTERFLKIGETETWYYYDRENFADIWPANYMSNNSTAGAYWEIYNHLIQPQEISHVETGKKLGEMTIKRAFYVRRDAVKAFSAGDTWADTDYIANRYTLGDGDGIGLGTITTETFQDVSAEFLLIESNEQNQVTREKIFRKNWIRPQGNAYWYEGDIESSHPREEYRISGTEETFYDQAEEGFHDETTLVFDEQGRFKTQSVESGIEGGLPAVDIIPTGNEADSTLYADEAEQEQLAKEARYGETRTIKVRVVSDFLELHHPKKEVKSSLAYAENAEELIKAAELLIDESSAGRVQFVLPANFLLAGLMDKGTPIHITFSPLGIDEDMVIRSLHWVGGYRTPKTVTVSGRLYGE